MSGYKLSATTQYSSLVDPTDRFAHLTNPATSNAHTATAAGAKSTWLAKLNPVHWNKWTWIGAGTGLAVVIIGGSVGGVEEAKANAYPDYTTLTYTLSKEYSGTTFFDNFTYWDTYDPSDGFVHYCNEDEANARNLTYASSTSAVLRVDNTETNATTGRLSARVTTTETWDTGLFIFDIIHAPYGCATWPAVWTTDPSNWPTNGEVDIVEAVNQATSGNQVTLHTTDDCTMDVKRKETGTVVTTNCWNETDSNAGCGVKGPEDTMGALLNTDGGGVYAMELRAAGIRVWFFPRDSIPADITNGTSPDPESWTTPLADFPKTDCDITSHFTNQSIIANIDVCGSWAGATSVYTTEDACPGTSCSAYAATAAAEFDEAYWEWSWWRVYSASS